MVAHQLEGLSTGTSQPSVVHGKVIFQHNHMQLLEQHLPSLICVKPSNTYLETHSHQHDALVHYLSLSLSLAHSFVSRLVSAFSSAYRFPLIEFIPPTPEIAKIIN